MMRNKKRRNRRKRVNGYAHRLPMAVFVVLAMMLLIGMLWVKADCDAIGTEIRKLEEVSQELSERLLTEEMKWNRLRSADRIRRSLATNGIQMDWPGRAQVVMLVDRRQWPVAESQDAAGRSHRYADTGRMGGYE